MLTDVTNAAGDGIVSGIRNGNLEEVANALLSLGPDVTYALLNGNPVGPAFSAGLFGPQGIVAGLLTLRDMVAAAITPPATSSLAVAESTVETGGSVVTLDVAAEVAVSAGDTEVVAAKPVSASTNPPDGEPEPAAVAPVAVEEEPVATPADAPEESVTPEQETPGELPTETADEESPTGAETDDAADDDVTATDPDPADSSAAPDNTTSDNTKSDADESSDASGGADDASSSDSDTDSSRGAAG